MINIILMKMTAYRDYFIAGIIGEILRFRIKHCPELSRLA